MIIPKFQLKDPNRLGGGATDGVLGFVFFIFVVVVLSYLFQVLILT